MKNLVFLSIVLSALVLGCANEFELRTRNLGNGNTVVSNEHNTTTTVVGDAVPIITIQTQNYQVDIYAFSDGGNVHYVSVVIAGGTVTASVSDRITKTKTVRNNSSNGSNKGY